jgi:hypothetical protein
MGQQISGEVGEDEGEDEGGDEGEDRDVPTRRWIALSETKAERYFCRALESFVSSVREVFADIADDVWI